eukprot:5903002-Pleurochrysis_carterae.AAC.2
MRQLSSAAWSSIAICSRAGDAPSAPAQGAQILRTGRVWCTRARRAEHLGCRQQPAVLERYLRAGAEEPHLCSLDQGALALQKRHLVKATYHLGKAIRS